MKTISRILSVFLVLALLCGVAAAAKFSDVEGHWGQVYIERWTDNGVISGYPDGTFRPDQYITRAEVAKILALAYEMPAGAEAVFADVSANAWYYTYVMACAGRDVINGYPDNTFKPDAQITRSEAAKMVCVAAGLSLVDSGYEKYKDADETPEWAKGYWNALIKAGVIDGYEDGTIRPNRLITRAEMVKILCFAMSELKIYELEVTISDNLGNTVTDKASYLTGDAHVVSTLLPLLVANRENYKEAFPSGDMRDLLDEGIALAKEGYAGGWSDQERAAWEAYITQKFAAYEGDGERPITDLLSDIDTTVASVLREEAYVMTFFDTEEGRIDIEYTVSITVHAMDEA